MFHTSLNKFIVDQKKFKYTFCCLPSRPYVSFNKVYNYLSKTSTFFFKFTHKVSLNSNSYYITKPSIIYNFSKIINTENNTYFKKVIKFSIKKKLFIYKKFAKRLFIKGYFFKKLNPRVIKVMLQRYSRFSYKQLNNWLNFSVIKIICNNFFFLINFLYIN